MNLTGKTALVTGSTSGIGLGIALKLAEAGADLILNGFGDASAALVEVGRHGHKVGHHGADVSDPAQIAELFAYAERDFGGIDILVNNAGIQHVAPVEQFPVERWDAIIAINLSSAFHTTRLALPGMRERNWGRIINVASAHGLVGSAQKSAYVAAARPGRLTKLVALETATTPITCNAICPGWVLTPLVQQQIDERARQDGDEQRARHDLLAEKQTLAGFRHPGAAGRPSAVSAARPATSSGAAWNMDGGWVAQ